MRITNAGTAVCFTFMVHGHGPTSNLDTRHVSITAAMLSTSPAIIWLNAVLKLFLALVFRSSSRGCAQRLNMSVRFLSLTRALSVNKTVARTFFGVSASDAPHCQYVLLLSWGATLLLLSFRAACVGSAPITRPHASSSNTAPTTCMMCSVAPVILDPS